MLTLDLLPVIQARGIERPYSFLVKAGINHHTAMNMLQSNTRSIRMDHMEILCRVLMCEPADLFQWTPSASQPVAPNHPLYKMHKKETAPALKELLASLPFDQLKEITSSIAKKAGGKDDGR